MKLYTLVRVLPAALLLIGCGSDSGGEDAPVCGDGVVAGAEECDDGNLYSGDACSGQCRIESGWDCQNTPCAPVCGDGQVVGVEVCDPIATPGYCSSDCAQVIGSCGDGIVQPEAESCDPGHGELRGCSMCDSAFAYTCDVASNTCTATGLPSDRLLGTLTEDETRQYCAWLVDVLGGEGEVWTCSDYQVTNSTIAACASTQYNNWGDLAQCTVAQVEDWASARSNRCSLLTSTIPVC